MTHTYKNIAALFIVVKNCKQKGLEHYWAAEVTNRTDSLHSWNSYEMIQSEVSSIRTIYIVF